MKLSDVLLLYMAGGVVTLALVTFLLGLSYRLGRRSMRGVVNDRLTLLAAAMVLWAWPPFAGFVVVALVVELVRIPWTIARAIRALKEGSDG